MSVSAHASAVERSRVCCASEDCSVVQCLEMGCLAVPSPLAGATHGGVLLLGRPVRDVPQETGVDLPNRYKEIWTPPD